jgi:hypothetical protein
MHRWKIAKNNQKIKNNTWIFDIFDIKDGLQDKNASKFLNLALKRNKRIHLWKSQCK